MSMRSKTCNGCGCHCQDCGDQTGLHLHVEIENLKQQLLERENHILSMETNFLKEADKFPNGEMAAISEELLTWQEKYSRLYEAHKRVQKVNQNLEDKLLKIVDKCETEKNALTNEVSNLTRRIVDEKFNVARLMEENERYRNDINLAIQLIQCKPSNFVSQKYDSLPSDMQQKVRSYVSHKRRQSDGNGNIQPKPEMKTIKVPIPTFPPTAMVYSVNRTIEKDSSEDRSSNQSVDIVSAAIMAKILEEREKERSQVKHCSTCSCSKQKHIKYTQTSCESSEKTGIIKNEKMILTVKNKIEKVETKTNSRSDSWESVSNDKSPSSGVTEGILVNIDSTENSSINSATSESSSFSWQSKTRNDEDLITFDRNEAKVTGPRHCSVRMQLGTNNILLDNIVGPITPVLYKSKNPDAMVHRSRSSSSNSSSDEHIAITSKKSIFRTETEI